MLDNFHLAAITRQGNRHRLYQIPLHRRLQETLAGHWQDQFNAFYDEVEEIDFDPGYTPEDHECFSLSEYELPDWLENYDSGNARNLRSVVHREGAMNATVGLVAFARDNEDDELMLFQNFTRSKVIQPGNFIFLSGDTFRSSGDMALSLDPQLSAIYLPDRETLLFRSYRTVNTFLPIADYFEEATTEQILELLEHERIAAEDPDRIASFSNQWFRKRFAMLQQSSILDDYTANDIAEFADGYGVDVQVRGEQIVFPANRQEAKRLLQFLNEERFIGAITATLFETNSKRAAS